MENYISSSAKLQLHFVTNDEAAKVDVDVKNPKFHQTLSVGSNSSTMVTLDDKYMVIGNEISSKVVTVTSDVDISVFGFNTATYSADASFILPVEDLGTEYFIFTPASGDNKQFAVATAVDRAQWINITVSGSLTYNGKSYSTGSTFSFSLGSHQVIQFQSSTDLTGTKVVSSAPVAVFTGHKCYSGLSNNCDILFQQMHPVRNWGTSFILFPLANHTKDIIDIMAAYADTTVKVDQKAHTLQSGSHIQYTLDKSIFVNASKPVWVSYLFRTTYGPFLTTVPPLRLSRQQYKFVTDSFYNNFITVVSQALSASEFFLDNEPMSQYSFTTKEMNGFRIWEVSLGKVHGVHEIFHKSSPFSIYVYGLEHIISYGYTMGLETKFPASSIIKPTEEPEVPPFFNCFPHRAEFHLPLSLVSTAKLNVSDVHLEDPTCKGMQKGKIVVINVPFNRCGSKVLNENGKTVYVNTVYGTVPRTGVHRIEVPLKCEMKSNKTLGWNLYPQIKDMVSLVDYNVSMKFYQTEAFTNVITMFPSKADLHGRLYVEVQVESDEIDLQIFVENCQAAPSLNDTEENYSVIREG
ncbi:IgGFc-binding protein-like [Pyxicephalus adspersus]|uniref:IgGFc-binding protein-like n=1 Tax=Pyxicephalus adspersus TaxID=30357 RepID=UPI003B59F617